MNSIRIIIAQELGGGKRNYRGGKARKIAISPTNIGNNRKIELKKIFEGFKTFFTHAFYRSLVISAQTASTSLNSLMLVKK